MKRMKFQETSQLQAKEYCLRSTNRVSNKRLVMIEKAIQVALGDCPGMLSWSLRLPAQILRNFQKIMLAGKRKSLYQTQI